jgi:magnesium-protoporphyrin O-methyltransferase
VSLVTSADTWARRVGSGAQGPRHTTQKLIDVLVAEGVNGLVVLDIGGGVGTVHLALLEAGARHAVDVDAS